MTRSKEPSFKTNEYALYGETDFWTRGDLSVSLSERRLNGMDFSLQLHYRATRLLWQRFWRCRARRSITTGSGAAATTFVFMSASPSFSLAVRAAVTYLAASSAKAQLAFSLAAFVAAFRHFLRVLRNIIYYFYLNSRNSTQSWRTKHKGRVVLVSKRSGNKDKPKTNNIR